MPLIVLLIVLALLIVLYSLLKGVDSARRWVRKHSSRSEECPSCRQRIVTGEVPDKCPECGVKLARNVRGELMIRLN